jgi:potassium efflux system protein
LKGFDTFVRLARGHLTIALGTLLFLTSVAGQAVGQKAPEGQKAGQKMPEVRTAPAPQASAPIPLAEVATQATEVSDFLRRVYANLGPSQDIEKIQKELPDLSRRMARTLQRTLTILQAQPTLETLQTEEQSWQKSQLDMGRWVNLLTDRATRLGGALGRLADLHKRWSQSLDSARAMQAPETIIQQITAVLPAIEAAQITLETQRSVVLDLQGRIADEVSRSRTVLAEIAQAQKTTVEGIAQREILPIWSPHLWSQARAAGFGRLRDVAADPWSDISQYLHDPASGMPIHIGYFLVMLVLFCAMRRQVKRWGESDSSSVMTTVSDRPCAAALIASLLFASSPYSPAPPTVRDLFEALALAPMIRLIKPEVHQRLVLGLYALAILFALDTVRHSLPGSPLLDQMMVMLEALGGMSVLWWSLAYEKSQRPLAQAPGSARLSVMRAGTKLLLVILGAGLVAGGLGYMRVGRLLVSGVLIGGALALTLSASVKILCAVAAFLLRVWPLRHLDMVRHHRDLLERRIYRFLVWFAIFGWLVRVLDYLGLFQPVLSLGKAILAARLQRGSISVSVEDILAFVLAVWAAYLLSAFIRFVLQEDVYPRRRVPAGMAYAASRLIHYIILSLGLVVGMGVLGLDLTRVTVLIGAFGVGIGFGLQSVVNNFVSGLILLFERPIHVGDTVEVANIQGQVERIGIRASVVRTLQGAEIIVPNSQLVTEQVTNWTLSDQLRRIDLPVGVNYSATPQKVIEVIEAVANSHPNVLKYPSPRALFLGFGDSAINFELRAWTDRYNDWYRIRSELAVGVYDAVHAAGMSFPFPQREVRVLHDSKT